MKRQKRQLTILLFTAIIASGCATGGTNTQETTTGPISVNTFEATPSPATADRRVNLNLELENTGDADAERVAARIFGPTWAGSPGQDEAWRSSDDEPMRDKSERTLSFGDLRAPGENTPSVPKQKSLGLTAPAYGQGREIDTTFSSRIYYKYETTGTSDLTLVSGERFTEEDMTRSNADLDTSSGPIDLSIQGTTPKVFYRDGGESPSDAVESDICITVTNTGSGTTFRNGEAGDEDSDSRIWNVDSEDENQVKLSLPDVGNIEFESKDGDQTVELVSGNEGFQCYTMTADNIASQDEQTANIQVTAEYNYMKEDQTTVTVEGRRGAGEDENNNDGGDDDEDGPGAPPTPE